MQEIEQVGVAAPVEHVLQVDRAHLGRYGGDIGEIWGRYSGDGGVLGEISGDIGEI